MIFAGGFLGSGKTTALAALAKRVIEDGMRVGFITNDQSRNLVDTVIVRQMLTKLGVPVEEVVKGCFCCKFDELIEHIEKILAHEPDLTKLDPASYVESFDLVRIVIDRLIKEFDPTGFNIGVNIGESAGQTIDHAHIHVIPRFDGDTPNPRGGVRGVIPGKANY